MIQLLVLYSHLDSPINKVLLKKYEYNDTNILCYLDSLWITCMKRRTIWSIWTWRPVLKLVDQLILTWLYLRIIYYQNKPVNGSLTTLSKVCCLTFYIQVVKLTLIFFLGGGRKGEGRFDSITGKSCCPFGNLLLCISTRWLTCSPWVL